MLFIKDIAQKDVKDYTVTKTKLFSYKLFRFKNR